jgi:hypothetical protein
MKKLFIPVILLALGIAAGALAQNVTSVTALGNSPSSGQLACGNTPTLLYSTTSSGGASPFGRLSITFQNQSAQAVYIAPRSDISTSNGGILLGILYQAVTFDRSSGNVSWYCITGSNTATVGWTEEK